MAITDKALRTLACNNLECNKSITFDRAEEKQTFDNPANIWLKSIRLIQTVDQRSFLYCSDVCEIMGTKSGQHNLPEPKKIIEDANPAAVQAAAAAADAAVKSNENLKTGTGGPVIVQG
jgi:hypothetical protein